MSNISVCIPCIEKHIVYLKDCLQSIEYQTFYPYEVIIVISNILNMDATKTYVNNLLATFTKLNIIVHYTKDMKYAGENRNKAVKISTGNIISFIDADDLMRKDRLYIINMIFKIYPKCIGILHYFYENITPHKIDCICDECKENFLSYNVEKYLFSDKLHFGHGSFKRELFDEFKFTNKPRGQDVEFVHNILEKHLKNLYIYKKPLTYYISNHSTFYNDEKI